MPGQLPNCQLLAATLQWDRRYPKKQSWAKCYALFSFCLWFVKSSTSVSLAYSILKSLTCPQHSPWHIATLSSFFPNLLLLEQSRLPDGSLLPQFTFIPQTHTLQFPLLAQPPIWSMTSQIPQSSQGLLLSGGAPPPRHPTGHQILPALPQKRPWVQPLFSVPTSLCSSHMNKDWCQWTALFTETY